MNKDPNFASEDLGLAPVNDDNEGDDFDAFNDDTFGAEEVWHEDAHEELAKYTEEERHLMQESDGFFDFENGADDMSPLEPEEHASNGRHEDLSNLAQELDNKIKLTAAGHAQLPPAADPAILNVLRFVPPGASVMPPFIPQMAPPQFPAGMMQQPPHFAAPPGLNDPAIMSMGQIPPQLMQQQQFLRQNNPMMSQPPPPPHGLKQSGARTLEDIERQLLSEQQNVRHNQQQQHQQQQHQQQQGRYNQQQQNHNFQQQQQSHNFQQQQHHQQQQLQQYQQQRQMHQHGNNFGNSGRSQNHYQQQAHHHHQQQQHHQQQHQQHQPRNRNPFDDKNRETFGDDFVEHHGVQPHHSRQQGQGIHLITPGHVHVLGILRGARERQGPGPAAPQPESTGNPMRDLELQRQATASAQARRFDRDEPADPADEYSGLMTQRERQWIINIQLSQLKCENPFLDDYYFTVFNLRKQHQQFISAGNADDESKTGYDDSSEHEPRQTKREEEGAQLLIQPDSPRHPYMPLQFTNSLGKLQAATVKAPRKIIDVGILNTDTSENVSQKDSRNFKLTLLELERLYNLLIEVEDCEKKLLALPTNTPMRVQVEDEREDAVKKFGVNLTSGNRLKRYLTVRKGKTLMKRGIRLLDDLQMGLVCTNLLQHFSSIVKKDREEQLLTEFWEHGLRKHFLGAPFELIHHYLTLLTAPTYSLKSFLTTPLGSSILIAIVHRASILMGREAAEHVESLAAVLTSVAEKLSECKDLSNPIKAFNMQLPGYSLSDSCFENLSRLQKCANSVK